MKGDNGKECKTGTGSPSPSGMTGAPGEKGLPGVLGKNGSQGIQVNKYLYLKTYILIKH